MGAVPPTKSYFVSIPESRTNLHLFEILGFEKWKHFDKAEPSQSLRECLTYFRDSEYGNRVSRSSRTLPGRFKKVSSSSNKISSSLQKNFVCGQIKDSSYLHFKLTSKETVSLPSTTFRPTVGWFSRSMTRCPAFDSIAATKTLWNWPLDITTTSNVDQGAWWSCPSESWGFCRQTRRLFVVTLFNSWPHEESTKSPPIKMDDTITKEYILLKVKEKKKI